jgi:hypothetical protein
MHRHKIIPMILIILSLINFLLAAPVEVHQGCLDKADADVPEDVIFIPESEKRSDELEKRLEKQTASTGSSPAPSAGEPPGEGTSSIQDGAPVSLPEIKQPGLSKSYSDPSIGVGSNPDASPGSTQSYPPLNRPELASDMGGPWSTKSYPPSDGSGPDLASNEGTKLAGLGSIMSRPPASTRPQVEPFPWNPHDWSETSSEAEPKENFMSKAKTFFDKLVYKFKFWPRGSWCFKCGTK